MCGHIIIDASGQFFEATKIEKGWSLHSSPFSLSGLCSAITAFSRLSVHRFIIPVKRQEIKMVFFN